MNRYELQSKLNYFLAKHFGIASDRKTYIIAKDTYVFEREQDDDRWIEYERVCGTQIFPINKQWLQRVEIFFGEGSLYRDYVKRHLTSK